MKVLLHSVFWLVLTTPLYAKEAKVSVQWLEPASTLEQLTQVALKESNIISDFAELISREFKIGAAMSIVVGGNGTPSFDEHKKVMRVPYSYLVAVVRAQSELEESRPQALAKGMDMVEYTLYHEFGHVLAGNMSVDADVDAEEISTWLMMTSWPNGGEQWFAAVQAFAKASQQLDGPLSDYWHAHSLYKSRQRELNCAILGRDPERYETLLPAVLEPQLRRSQCVDYWAELENRVQKQVSSLKTVP